MILEHTYFTSLRFIRLVALWYVFWTLSMMLAVAIGYLL